ncbi:prepilin-type N-terminal cleavage/methylation domain-containing protein [bacterium]|nr:prepilin-type N-terminal cleavage/methylation domain-containing protein [bacterium]
MQKGFTLIELLIVVAIIGILAAIAVPNFMNARIRAKISKAESDLRNVGLALESYRLDNNLYPQWTYPSGQNKTPVSIRLYPLTTPIAYMSTVPQCPFVYGAANARIRDDQNSNWDTYDYADAWSRIHYKGLTKLPSQQRCAEWRITSWGPDNWNSFGNTYAYDASNGLRSWGDIIRVGPRASYPCDDTYVGK